jgi:hypothetical protein
MATCARQRQFSRYSFEFFEQRNLLAPVMIPVAAARPSGIRDPVVGGLARRISLETSTWPFDSGLLNVKSGPD